MQKGQTINLGGLDTFVIDDGEPDLPVIVLVHGFPTSSWDFEKIWPVLREKHRLITLDMHGFGFSAKPNERTYTIHKQADLFAELLRRLDIPEYHMLAHDYGVSVAQELLARQDASSESAVCLSCCFLNGGLFPETHRALLTQKLLLSPLGKLLNTLLGFSKFSQSFSSVFGEKTKPSQQELELFWESINYNNGKHLFHNLITYMRDRKIHRERWVSALRDASIPLGIINGSVDPVSGAHLVDRYQELGCRLDFLRQLPTIGHYPHTEDPNSVSSAYLEFLTTCTEAS